MKCLVFRRLCCSLLAANPFVWLTSVNCLSWDRNHTIKNLQIDQPWTCFSMCHICLPSSQLQPFKCALVLTFASSYSFHLFSCCFELWVLHSFFSNHLSVLTADLNDHLAASIDSHTLAELVYSIKTHFTMCQSCLQEIAVVWSYVIVHPFPFRNFHFESAICHAVGFPCQWWYLSFLC